MGFAETLGLYQGLPRKPKMQKWETKELVSVIDAGVCLTSDGGGDIVLATKDK